MTPVPPFATYYPSPEDMDARQRRFFAWLAGELDAGRYPPVDGQISYLFAYTYTQLAQASARGFGWVHTRLVELAEAYWGDPKFTSTTLHWANDCLLGIGAYERFLELTEPDTPFGLGTHRANLRANVAEHLGLRPHSFDVIGLSNKRLTAHTRANLGAYRHHLDDVLAEWEAELGMPVLQHLRQAQGGQTYGYTLFIGAPIDQPALPIPYYAFYGAYAEGDRVRTLSREAENRLRDALEMPRVGEGWIAETALFRAVTDAFPQTLVVQHGRPPWLGRQHFDIWLPRWNVAVEYHGAQHFEPVEFFGGEAGYEATVERDARKATLCAQHDVALIVVTEATSTGAVVAQVEALRDLRSPDRA